MDTIDSSSLMGFFMFFSFICLALAAFSLVCLWKIYEKAGQKGWKALIPIYNLIILLKIIERPVWWIFLLIIPVVNIVFAFIINFDLAKVFGKGTGFALGLVFLSIIFHAILAFGDAKYIGYQDTESFPVNTY